VKISPSKKTHPKKQQVKIPGHRPGHFKTTPIVLLIVPSLGGSLGNF